MGSFTGWGAGRAGSGSGSRAVGQVANWERVGMLGKMVDILGGRRVLLLRGGGDNNAGWEMDAIQAEGDQRELTP
ncbi:hypothetical protein ACFX2I_043602 [Malus domestica]